MGASVDRISFNTGTTHLVSTQTISMNVNIRRKFEQCSSNRPDRQNSDSVKEAENTMNSGKELAVLPRNTRVEREQAITETYFRSAPL